MTADVIVVGGGIMGCSVALALAEAGLSPLVLERSVPGAEASSAAAGILGPAIEAHHPGPGLVLGLESRELHAAQAERLRLEHALEVGFNRCGVMRVAHTDDEVRELELQAEVLAGAGVPCERLDGDGARAREPGVSPEVQAALELREEAQIDPPRLLRALAIAAERAGARFRTGAVVRRVLVEGDRARGVMLGDERLEAPWVVVAAGSWTTLVPGLGLSAEVVTPVRGQIVTCDTRPPLLRRIVFGAGGYVVPRPDGRTLCGSTEERVGFRREVTVAGLASILATATRIAPGLGEARVTGYWSSFRPGTPDDLPLVGGLGPEGLLLASGHYRNGILLGPITAELVADEVLGRPRRPEAEALSPRRFVESER